jgi:hypothetical protein
MMKRLILSCCASMATRGWLAIAAGAAPKSAPRTPSGEQFSALGGPTAVTCTLDSVSGTFAFTASGAASGNYAGTFQESGNGTVDRSTQTLSAFYATFSITASAFYATFSITALDGSTTVTGTTALVPAGSPPAVCQQTATTTLTSWEPPASTTNQATIYTRAGNYHDQGTSLVQSFWTSGPGGTSLVERFTSALKAPKPINKYGVPCDCR